MTEIVDLRRVDAPHCAACGGSGDVRYEAVEDWIFGTPGQWSFRACKTCDLLWLDPRPVAEDLPKLYQAYYTHTGTPDLKPVRPSSPAKRFLASALPWRRHMFLTALLHLEDMEPGRLLEVGCGNGAFLATAASSGWAAVGIDFDPRAVAAAASLPGVKAWAGDLLEAPFAANDFDAIVMNNVLEHLDRPLETLTRCRELLKPAGRFVAVTPNSRSTGHGLFKSGWRGLEPPRHLNIFGPASLRTLARRAGFSRVTTFTSSGGSSGKYMLEASRGRRVNAPVVLGLEKMLALLGVPVGEWGVLICHA